MPDSNADLIIWEAVTEELTQSRLTEKDQSWEAITFVVLDRHTPIYSGVYNRASPESRSKKALFGRNAVTHKAIALIHKGGHSFSIPSSSIALISLRLTLNRLATLSREWATGIFLSWAATMA